MDFKRTLYCIKFFPSCLPYYNLGSASYSLSQDPEFNTAYSEISRGGNKQPASPPPDKSIQGLSVRTPEWRFTAWVPFLYSLAAPDWDLWNRSLAELYDHRMDRHPHEDYDQGENVNLAADAQYSNVVAQLTKLVQDRWPSPRTCESKG